MYKILKNYVGMRGCLFRTNHQRCLEKKIIFCQYHHPELWNFPLYLSIDIDVLDPAYAPGTGTPEIAGMTTREIVNVIRGFSGMNLISADVVEVSPVYDHAEVTSLAAATIIYELTNLFAKKKL